MLNVSWGSEHAVCQEFFVVLSPFTGLNIVYLGECIRGGKQDEKHVNLQRLKEERDITLRLTIFLNHAWNRWSVSLFESFQPGNQCLGLSVWEP